MNNFNNNIIIEIGCTGPCVGFQENAKACKQCKDMSVLYSNKYVNERFEKENSQGRSPNYSVRVLWVLAAYQCPSHTTSSMTESFDIIIYNVYNILYILYIII